MKILFLDDMEARHELVSELATKAGFDIDHTYTAEDAIKKLESYSYDAAMLDCDLADDHYTGPYASPAMGGTSHSGRAVARWIAEHKTPKTVLVHSFNPVGAIEMMKILDVEEILAARGAFGPVTVTLFFELLGKLA